MNTTTDITTPLYDNGPSIDDLNADGSPWQIPLDLIDDYLEAVGPGPSRQLINQHEANLDDVHKAALRDVARMDCGEPPLWPEQHVMMWPERAREVGAIPIRDPRDYANPATGWPRRGSANRASTPQPAAIPAAAHGLCAFTTAASHT